MVSYPSIPTDATMRPAERQAVELLNSAWIRREGGVFAIPVDPFHVAGKLGLRAFVARLDPDVSGMLVKHPQRDAEIYVAESDSEVRQRFSCAHEIGHYVLRASGRADDSFGYVDRRSEAASLGLHNDEIFANQFAAELLMPQANVRAFPRWMAVAAMAVKFQVSVGAMQYRLENLGLSR